MNLKPGLMLGHYRLVSPLGAGGMGEVYRATDTKLGRDVALKMLPDLVAQDPARLARFQREAQLLASLNHPHIAAIHGLGDAEGTPFLVLELVEGEDLSERLNRGPISVEEAIPIARQIAEAFEAAHEKNIVHRDLKPANVKISLDGNIKVLDFGLAKAIFADEASGSSVDLSQSPTLTAAETKMGVILGTAAYMSPEQARGKKVDRRADIWSFGVVLHEMLTGQRLFAGDTVTDTLAAVLKTDPDWSVLPEDTPFAIRALLGRCLERDPKRRLRDIGEARIVLENPFAAAPEQVPGATVTEAVTTGRRIWPWLVALLLATLVGLALGRFALEPDPSRAQPVRFEIATPGVSSAVISPDGTKIVFASQKRLWVRDLAHLETRELEGTEGAVRPFWSPDGSAIAYGARGKLWRVPLDSGAPTTICDLDSGLWDQDAGGGWMPDGTILFSNGNAGLFQVSSKGGDPITVLKPDPQSELHFHTASRLPDGRGLLYIVHRAGEGAGVDTIGLWADGKERVLLQSEGQALDAPTYSSSGHILFTRSPTNAGVWAVPFSLAKLELTGEPFLVSASVRDPSVSSDGTLVLLPAWRTPPLDLVWVDREAKPLGRIDEPRIRRPSVAISPDGGRVAIAERTQGEWDIWLYDLRRNTRSRLTDDGRAGAPSWLPDGRSLLYASSVGGASMIKRVAADGSGRVDEIVLGRAPAASHDGALVFYILAGPDGFDLWHRSLEDGDEEPVLFAKLAAYTIAPHPSPDGGLVAIVSEPAPDSAEIYLRRFPASEGTWQVSSSGGERPRWSHDGRRLYFARGNDVFEVEVQSDPDVQLGAPVRLFTRKPTGAGWGNLTPGFDVSPDGNRFLIFEPVGAAKGEPITVVLNWFAELETQR